MFKKSLWFLSGFCTVLFFVPGFQYAWAVLLIAAALLLWLSLADNTGKRLGFSHRWVPNLLGLLFLTGCGLIFYYRWEPVIGMYLALACTIGLCIISSYFVLTTIARIFIRSWPSLLPVAKRRGILSLRSRAFIAVCVTALLILCSACSFLYPVNPGVSANTLMTGGRSMLSGIHMYEDLYGAAGPVPYFFNASSWLLFHDFTGVFILEIVLDVLFFIYMMKMVALFFDVNRLILAFPIVAFVFFSSQAFYNGDTSEEFCLFFLCVSFYIALRELSANRIPGYSHFLLTGLCIGFVLWTQYSILGFYIGWILLPLLAMMVKGRWKKLFLSLIVLVMGTAIASVPVVYYFYANHTLDAFLQAYFKDPIVLEMAHGYYALGAVKLFGRNLLQGILNNPLLFLQTALSLICALRISRRLFWQILLCFAGMVVGQYGFFHATPSSPLLWSVFGGFALILYYQFYQALELTYFRQFPIRVWGLLIAVIICYFASSTTRLADHKETDFAQIQTAGIIDQIQDASLLTYNMPDRGFYTYCDRLPRTKYYNGEYDESSVYLKDQVELIKKGQSDFIVTQQRLSPALLNEGKYSLIKAMTTNTPDGQSYYLYTRNSLLEDITW